MHHGRDGVRVEQIACQRSTSWTGSSSTAGEYLCRRGSAGHRHTATSHGFAPEVEALWQSMLRSLASEAVDGEQIMFPDAGHFLQIERAHEVAREILRLVPPAS
jgi:pimeloyl-ACP methyl ester carboxylesterase